MILNEIYDYILLNGERYVIALTNQSSVWDVIPLSELSVNPDGTLAPIEGTWL